MTTPSPQSYVDEIVAKFQASQSDLGTIVTELTAAHRPEPTDAQLLHIAQMAIWEGNQTELEAQCLQFVGEVGRGLDLLSMGGNLSHPVHQETLGTLRVLLMFLDRAVGDAIRNRAAQP